MIKSFQIFISGVVQGVGFRPFVYNLAVDLGLKGWVLNSSEGVKIEIEGEEDKVVAFIDGLKTNPPPRSSVEQIETEEQPPKNYDTFEIRESREELGKYQLISPDISICDDCARELIDPDDRRYRYPFINCTNCGPRFTIIEDIPYDRPKTTMRNFKMCPDCQREYDDPRNRRFHAQPNACAKCGPQVFLTDADGARIEAVDPIAKTAELLIEGKIVAIKGLGGFHLACDAVSDEAVGLLRERKRRFDKPLAVMFSSIAEAGKYCDISDDEKKLLLSHQRPVVLVKWKKESGTSPSVAPGQNYLGAMIPYTPLHHLILRAAERPLVMTSGNLSEEPIAKDNDEALRRLGKIADYFLLHDREIFARYDDSVARIFEAESVMIRRSRGYAPYPVHLPFATDQMIACGAELKNSFCMTKDNFAFISQHIGDLENLETLEHFEGSIELYKKLFRIDPVAIAYDLHPQYLSTQYALDQAGVELIGVQHHHAHIASCLVENERSGPVIGVAFDGLGYGTDGTLWGGEFLLAGLKDFERAAHFREVPMPGGTASIERPNRMAAGYLFELFGGEALEWDIPMLERFKKEELTVLRSQIKKGINCPKTTSCGRLFDAVAALLGLRDSVSYEGQAAMELEMLADEKESDIYNFDTDSSGPSVVIDPSGIFTGVMKDLDSGLAVNKISGKFHNTIATIVTIMCAKLRQESSIEEVALSGGVFQNQLLLAKTLDLLRRERFEPMFHEKVPTNDGGISLGQIAVAHSRRMSIKK